MSGQPESSLRQLFEDIQSKPPGIISIDDLGPSASNREKTHGEVEPRRLPAADSDGRHQELIERRHHCSH
jgi:SpoVK/Ycf46/Vps4 family AAA+-type ATPase